MNELVVAEVHMKKSVPIDGKILCSEKHMRETWRAAATTLFEMLVMHDSWEWKAVDQIFGGNRFCHPYVGLTPRSLVKLKKRTEFRNIQRREIHSIE